MNRRSRLPTFTTRAIASALALLSVFSGRDAQSAEKPGRPNIVVIRADDMGFSDIEASRSR